MEIKLRQEKNKTRKWNLENKSKPTNQSTQIWPFWACGSERLFADMTAKHDDDREKFSCSLTKVYMLLKKIQCDWVIPKPSLFEGGKTDANIWLARHSLKIFDLRYGLGSKCHKGCESSWFSLLSALYKFKSVNQISNEKAYHWPDKDNKQFS